MKLHSNFLANFYFWFFSYASDGNVKDTSNAVIATIIKIKLGMGLSNSATRGARIVKPRAIKLQIPIAVDLFRIGNI